MAIPKSNQYRCRCCLYGTWTDPIIPEGVIKHMTYSFKGIKMDTPHDALALKRIYKELKDHPKAHARMPSLLHVLDQEAEDEAKENMKKEAVW